METNGTPLRDFQQQISKSTTRYKAPYKTCPFCGSQFGEVGLDGCCCTHHNDFMRKINSYTRSMASDFAEGVPARYKNISISDVNGHEDLKRFVKENKYTENVFIHGPVGCGKTMLLSCLIKIRNRNVQWAHYYRSIDIVSRFRAMVTNETSEQRILDDIKDTARGLMIIDDIGTEKTSEFSLQCLYMLIDDFYNENRPIVFTSNLNPKELAGALGDRIASRVCSGKIFKLDGADGRLKK